MKFNQSQKDAFQKAAFICSRAEKSPNKIKQKLLEWGLSKEEVEPVLEKLIAEKYLDYERYSRSFVKDKFRFNKWGKNKIAYHLRADKIPDSIIDLAMEEIDNSDYEETLFEVLSGKSKKIKAVNQYDKKAKLFRFAQSRGFESDLTFKAIELILAGS